MPRHSWLEEATHRTAVVHTNDGRSIRGVLAAVYADELVLVHAQYLGDDGTVTALDGDVGVPRANVSFVQVIAPPTGLGL